jgi:NAD(P)-dependent dehydrogenase (short-subunit alcohol dehydrogenase family)
MKTRLENQIAIVTGSSSDNGRAIALALSSAGATVVCADLNKKAREEGYEEDIEIDTDDVIQRRGGKAVYVQADVRYASEVENLVTLTVSEFGHLDIMVNNAGVLKGRKLKVNMIIDGSLYNRDSVVDNELIPERFRDATYVDYALEGVLLLRDLSFQSLPRQSASGIATSFPTFVAAGELIDLAQVPHRESLKEGEDYKTDWTFEEQAQLKLKRSDIYRDSESYQPDAGLMRRNR